MSLKERIEQDLKTALLARTEDRKVLTLRGIKSVILNEEISHGLRDEGLKDDDITKLLAKESKKRQESADLYIKGGDSNRANLELEEKTIIDAYLPQKLSTEELTKIVDQVMQELGSTESSMLGVVIGKVKQQVGTTADGGEIARLVKERIT